MLARVFKSGHSGATFGGIGTLDMAIWDLKAKAAGEPLWRLLGARDRFVTGYASGLDIALDDEQLAAWYRSMGERGFTSGKLKGGRDVAADLRRLGILSDALAANTQQPAVMLDANESWNLKQAVRHVTAIEQHVDLTWIEEPLRRWDAAGHARLTRSIRAAVATGENLTGLEQYAPLLDHGAVDIVQAGSVWGVSHFLRVAYAAHSRDLPVSPVGLSANPAVAAAAAAVPNHLSAEVQDLGSPFGITIDQEIADGGIVLGDSPGNGVTVDEAAIDREPARGTWSAAGGPARALAPRWAAARRRRPGGDGRLRMPRRRAERRAARYTGDMSQEVRGPGGRSFLGAAEARIPAARLGVAVVHDLVSAIVTGEVAPGDSLPPEDALSAHFGVSRTVIRESVKRIEEKGLVTVVQGRGTQAQPSTSWNILDPVVLSALLENDSSLGVLDELATVRSALEGSMSAEVATRAQRRRARAACGPRSRTWRRRSTTTPPTTRPTPTSTRS